MDALLMIFGSLLYFTKEYFWGYWELVLGKIARGLIFASVALWLFPSGLALFINGSELNAMPAWYQWSILIVGLLIVVDLISTPLGLAIRGIKLGPLDFFDYFSSHCLSRGKFAGTHSAMRQVGQEVRRLWGKRHPQYVRRSAVQIVIDGLQRLKSYVIGTLVITYPLLMFSFALVSSAGHELRFWEIRTTNNIPIRSLADHLYFSCSVISSLGLGDTTPLVDQSHSGQLLVVMMVTTFIVIGLVIFSLLVAFIHAVVPAVDSFIGNMMSDLGMYRISRLTQRRLP